MKVLSLCTCILLVVGVTGCSLSKSETVTHNIIEQAENYQLYRRITVINQFSDKVTYVAEGFLDFKNENDGDLSVTFQIAKNEFKRDVIQKSQFDTVLVEQLRASEFSPYSYKIIIYAAYPDIELP